MSPRLLIASLAIGALAHASAPAPEPGLLFYLSADHGTTADYSAADLPKPTYEAEISSITDGARNGALECGNYQLLAYRAPGNIYAQRGTLSFFWRSRYPVGPTAFPIFRVGYADHSSWDMVFLRVDYNGHGFDAFVTDASLSRVRVSVPMTPFPEPKAWTHLAVAWDETQGLRFYVNGKLAAKVDTRVRLDLALDQFGPHSRIISPHQVQSDYNFVRGGDIDEVKIYDHMLDDANVARVAKGDALPTSIAIASTAWDNPAIREAWAFRYGWNQTPPPALPARPTVTIRKVGIQEAYDLKRWWWKANDGLRETTWPGVYNRSRLTGRDDYFQLPDWDCYVESGQAVTFLLPNEPWNHLEISGTASGKVELLPAGTPGETAYTAKAESVLFARAQGQERTIHALSRPLAGRQVRFVNAEQEQPIGEFDAYNITSGQEPAGSSKLSFRITAGSAPELAKLAAFIAGRYPVGERTLLAARPSQDSAPDSAAPAVTGGLPIIHVAIPCTWDNVTDGLDGVAIDLPALPGNAPIPLNIQVKDPVWPLRTMLDVTFTAKPGESRTLWLDLRDRILPAGKPLWLTVASGTPDVGASTLIGSQIRLVFKPRDLARVEHEQDRFTQVRDVYAMMVEEHPGNPRLDMWNRFKADLDDLLRVNSEHMLGRQYAAFGTNQPPPPFTQLEPPAGVPLWAFRQVTLLGEVKRFVEWYVDHRQVAYGDFGGGISDDVDLLNTWPGLALMGCDPEKLKASDAALLDAAFKNGMFTNGLPTIQADELHSYEEGINCLGQNLIIDFGSPRQLERAMATARGVESITGVNAAGHRHIRTSYYSGTKQATEDPWGYAKPYSYLVLQVPQLLVSFNGNPATKQWLLEVADGLLAHRHTGGRPGVPAVHFVDDREDDVGRGYFPSHVFWAAYVFTGDRRYLVPILENPVTSLTLLNANVLDLLELRKEWGARLQAGERAVPVEGRRDAGRTRERTSGFRASNTGHFAWQLNGDKTQLENLYAEQIQLCSNLYYINTEGSLWIDRVGVPITELQRARLGGVALVRNGVFPGHALSWEFAAPASGQSVAVLVPNSTTTELKIIAYNLETSPVQAKMTGWMVDPGQWEITQGVDTNDDDTADQAIATRTVAFGRSESVTLTLPPRASTVLTLKLKTPGTPYWQRPDVGIERQDVTQTGSALQVRVHSLGSVAAPATTLVVRDIAGKVIATASVPALPAPLDLVPKTTDVSLALPSGASLTGATVELDPNHQLEQITRLNDAVKL